jgi:hypothetical protein
LIAVALSGEESLVVDGIARLMRPVANAAPLADKRGFWLLALAAGITRAVLLGTAFGERAVCGFLTVV